MADQKVRSPESIGFFGRGLKAGQLKLGLRHPIPGIRIFITATQ